MQQNFPITLILGNPPYSVNSANKNKWIDKLVRDYYYGDGISLKERNSKNLKDDYVKFFRLSQWIIDKTGSGILAFITNHSYLDNPTFRGMRQSLIHTFTDIYILDLHGNAKKRETCPDGSPDENVFDIQQGVCVGFFIKKPGVSMPAQVHHAEIWGNRVFKYNWLKLKEIDSIQWQPIKAQSPFYLFKPQNLDLQAEYEAGWKITDVMPVHSTGIKTHRDCLVFDFDFLSLKTKIENFKSLSTSYVNFISYWKPNQSEKLHNARQTLANDPDWKNKFTQCLYRPFDLRAYYNHFALVDRPRNEVMKHIVFQENLALITHRQILGDYYNHWFCSDTAINHNALDIAKGAVIFPLYLYCKSEIKRTPNLSQTFLTAIEKKLGYLPTPEAIFYYAYAVFHSDAYRQRYAEFLKIDFPRLPLTGNSRLFQSLSEKGEELVELHLMKSQKLNRHITDYPIKGDNAVTHITYHLPQKRVYINKQQYFVGIAPEVWAFKIGGYQILDKWLKDRKKAKRRLSFDDISHYHRIILALQETLQIMAEIDQMITSWPLA